MGKEYFMRTLKKSECNILHLVLKRKWFDMIDSGEKQEEYRDETPHWERIYSWWENRGCRTNVVAFQNGYHKPTMWFVVDGISTSDVSTSPDWGEPNHPHHILFLGERIIVEEVTEKKEKKMDKTWLEEMLGYATHLLWQIQDLGDEWRQATTGPADDPDRYDISDLLKEIQTRYPNY